MRLNQGIQKYRDANRTSSAKASSTDSKKKPASAAKEKGSAAKAAKPVKPERPERKETLSPEEVKLAAEEIQAAEIAAREEAELQKQIAEELEQEASQTAQLVKEDFSPVNSTRDKLVNEYAPLIKYIAQKIAARLPANIELDDLMSSGVIGLMDAIEKYDASRDNKFKTYAEFRIRGAILDELRAQDWVPRSVREKAKVLERCYSKIEQTKGRQATDEEICEELKISQEEYHDLLNQVRSVSLLSYDDILNFSKADKRSLHGMGENGTKVPTPYSEVTLASIKRMIADAIRELPEKQRLVLSLYYYEDLNLKEIGRVLDVTESRVSQLHTQAIIRLKSKLRTHWDEVTSLLG
ncbi:MAG TPA: FliA/WhiG family RNA polymerase sigma factor [Bdellovibrionales bacterium]|nr:FliA/WhiG family RNA polymerase sigma factor [Bdellovibrionales bacterium]HCM39626.1 FliA/WhiG family RNA polymerase sigma factor [Bdellovibrionales bacterium]